MEENRKDMNQLTKWAVNKIETEYKDDIALLIGIKGHSTGSDGHGEVFDYYIPATEKGYELAQTFIIDGIGYDLYPRSWELMEKSVTLDDMTLLLTNAEILYARSKEDTDRFLALQQKLQSNLADPVFVYRKALDRLDAAMELYRTLLFEEKSCRARSEAGRIHLYLSQAVAFMNHTYTESPLFSETQAYTGCPESRMYHCPDLNLVPDSFFEYAGQLLRASAPDQIRRIVYTLIRTVRQFVLERKPEAMEAGRAVNYQNLADWYQELCLTWRRIHFFCEHQMVEEAYTDACNLQEELIVIAQEFQIEELSLLDSFDPASLQRLDLRSRKLEQIIRGIITANGIRLKEYASVDEFLADDPA